MAGFGSMQEAEKTHFALSLLTMSHMKSTGHDCVKTAGLPIYLGNFAKKKYKGVTREMTGQQRSSQLLLGYTINPFSVGNFSFSDIL